MAATQKLISLYEGRLDVTTPEVAVEVLPNMDLDSDAIILRVTDNREVPEDITIDLTMLRAQIRCRATVSIQPPPSFPRKRTAALRFWNSSSRRTAIPALKATTTTIMRQWR